MQNWTSHKPESRNPRHHNSAETREAILEAAEHIFGDEGLEGARTDAIATAAGVNKALLYYYFRSKEGLYRAVLEGYLADFNRQAWNSFLQRVRPARSCYGISISISISLEPTATTGPCFNAC